MSGLPSEWLSPKFIFYFRWVAYEVAASFYVFLLGTVHFSYFNLNLPQLEVSIFLKIFKKLYWEKDTEVLLKQFLVHENYYPF